MRSFITDIVVVIVLLAFFSSAVFANEHVGDPDCVIAKADACGAAAEKLDMEFVTDNKKKDHAWGCIIREGDEGKVVWKGKKGKGKTCDGKKCKNKFDKLDSAFTRVFCGLEEEEEAETSGPTSSPTSEPTSSPTISSSSSPTSDPTASPTTSSPTSSPTESPTSSPTSSPTASPTKGPTDSPTSDPTSSPREKEESAGGDIDEKGESDAFDSLTVKATIPPTSDSSSSQSSLQSELVTEEETEEVTEEVTEVVTEEETVSPTAAPSSSRSAAPSELTTQEATSSPTTEAPVLSPTEAPVPSPTEAPVPSPTEAPVPSPTEAPVSQTEAPVSPTLSPTLSPVDPTEPPKVVTCYDYTNAFDLGQKECTSHSLYKNIRAEFERQQEESDEPDCKGGLHGEMYKLTGSPEDGAWYPALQVLCDVALARSAEETPSDSWSSLEAKSIDLEEFFEGGGFLNDETGNFHQKASEFERRGGTDRFSYVGDDPRLNDYMRTTEKSYAAGQAIMTFYGDEAKTSFLSPPTTGFENGCEATNAAVCCWHRDRQYYDNNGHCHFGWCKDKDPGDNTDLCWIEGEEDGEVYPYPGEETEGDLHCHGFAWPSNEVDDAADANDKAKWNNLFFVSMYDHLYQRGYVDSVTDNPMIAGAQAMCGCVEDMNPIARADCTQVVARSEYTAYQDENTGLLVVENVPGTFELEYKACEGYDYDENMTPEEFAEFDYNPHSAGLTRQNNDLAAFAFRQYLEGKVDESHIEAFEETIIGYRDPTVNDGDEEREVACKAAFEKRYPNKEWVERELEIEEEIDL